ncbi:DUF3467 domain-containing protein [Candidatus Uhrbacteria bacterium]|nr:DUF3467 domain-containing protein [Candidatus Uhrbacteria bacterium]
MIQPNQPQPSPSQQGQQIQLKADDQTLKGVYANLVQINRTKEEFVLDFINLFPPMATLNSRVIMSPGHIKRLAGVLVNLVKQHEDEHGAIEAAKQPEGIGFDTNR